MEAIAHILWFYFFARFARLKIKWVGMLTAFLMDLFIFCGGWCSRPIGDIDPSCMCSSLHNFLHSIFVVLIFVPLLYYGKGYFLSAAVGAYSHLFLDIFTHHGFPHPLFPFSNYVLPAYLIDGTNPILIIGANALFLAMIFYFEWDAIKGFIQIGRKKIESFKPLFIIGMIIITAICTLYIYRTIPATPGLALLVIIPLASINAIFLTLIFLRECSEDERLMGYAMRVRMGFTASRAK